VFKSFNMNDESHHVIKCLSHFNFVCTRDVMRMIFYNGILEWAGIRLELGTEVNYPLVMLASSMMNCNPIPCPTIQDLVQPTCIVGGISLPPSN